MANKPGKPNQSYRIGSNNSFNNSPIVQGEHNTQSFTNTSSSEALPGLKAVIERTPNKLVLSSQQKKKLQEALIHAFPTIESLEQMLSYRLDKNLGAVAGKGNLQDIVFELIRAADSQGWLGELISAACDENPGNLRLRDIARELLSDNQ